MIPRSTFCIPLPAQSRERFSLVNFHSYETKQGMVSRIPGERVGLRPLRALRTYLSRYRNKDDGKHDLLWAFRLIRENFGCRRVLYPGSYLHITPSLVFPEVCYVDSVKGIGQDMAATVLLEYVNIHKDYTEDAVIRCWEEDYRSFTGEPTGSFDLLVSLNAGFISQHCRHFLKPGGFLLANNGHYDAARAYVDPCYRLVGAFDGGSLLLESSYPNLSSHFRTAKGEALTLEMVEADAKRPPSGARYMPSREMEAYLFQRIPAA